jgi:hypothetical protein
LRSEVDALRPQAAELAKARAENRRLRAATGEPDDPAEAEFKKETRHRDNHLKQWGLMFHVFAGKANDQSPDRFEQVADQVPDKDRVAFLEFATNNFEIVYQGKLGGEAGETILS